MTQEQHTTEGKEAMAVGAIPDAQYKAMQRLCAPLIEAAYAMTAEEIVLAMRGFYATNQTNCPWYAYGLRHTLPPILATIGDGKEGYAEAWGLQPQGEDAQQALSAGGGE